MKQHKQAWIFRDVPKCTAVFTLRALCVVDWTLKLNKLILYLEKKYGEFYSWHLAPRGPDTHMDTHTHTHKCAHPHFNKQTYSSATETFRTVWYFCSMFVPQLINYMKKKKTQSKVCIYTMRTPWLKMISWEIIHRLLWTYYMGMI